MMWAAGAVAAMSSITFPAVSALVSRTADADQQGELLGICGNYSKRRIVCVLSLLRRVHSLVLTLNLATLYSLTIYLFAMMCETPGDTLITL